MKKGGGRKLVILVMTAFESIYFAEAYSKVSTKSKEANILRTTTSRFQYRQIPHLVSTVYTIFSDVHFLFDKLSFILLVY